MSSRDIKPQIGHAPSIMRKGAVPIEVKRDLAQRVKERQLIAKMTKQERLFRPGNWFITLWDGLMC